MENLTNDKFTMNGFIEALNRLFEPNEVSLDRSHSEGLYQDWLEIKEIDSMGMYETQNNFLFTMKDMKCSFGSEIESDKCIELKSVAGKAYILRREFMMKTIFMLVNSTRSRWIEDDNYAHLSLPKKNHAFRHYKIKFNFKDKDEDEQYRCYLRCVAKNFSDIYIAIPINDDGFEILWRPEYSEILFDIVVNNLSREINFCNCLLSVLEKCKSLNICIEEKTKFDMNQCRCDLESYRIISNCRSKIEKLCAEVVNTEDYDIILNYRSKYFENQNVFQSMIYEVLNNIKISLKTKPEAQKTPSHKFECLFNVFETLTFETNIFNRLINTVSIIADDLGVDEFSLNDFLSLMPDDYKHKAEIESYVLGKNPRISSFIFLKIFNLCFSIKENTIILNISANEWLSYLKQRDIKVSLDEREQRVYAALRDEQQSNIKVSQYQIFCFSENGYERAMQLVQETEVTQVFRIDFNPVKIGGDIIIQVPKYTGVCYQIVPAKNLSSFNSLNFFTKSMDGHLINVHVEVKNRKASLEKHYIVEINQEKQFVSIDLKQTSEEILANVDEICFVFKFDSFKDSSQIIGEFELEDISIKKCENLNFQLNKIGSK